MRIAYVINSVEGGGAALPVPAVAQLMQRHGHEVEVFALTRRDGRALEPMRRAGLQVHVRDGGQKDHPAAFAWLLGRMRAWRPDLIWTSLTRATLLGQVAGRLLSVPVVSWQHAAFLKPANRYLLQRMQHLSGLWVADSRCVEELTRTRLGVPPDRLAVWPLFAADPERPTSARWRSGEPIRIGSLGRLHPVKGYDVLLEAVARVQGRLGDSPPFEVTIAGEGAERAALTAQIQRLRLQNVTLAGFAEQPAEFLAGLHLYVQPSRSEGLCIAAHEAMQAGLPTLVSAVGEMPYSVRDGETGLVVPPDDPEALAQALAWLIAHPERLAPMGEAARSRILERLGQDAFARAGAEIMARLPSLAATRAAGDQSQGRPENRFSASRSAG